MILHCVSKDTLCIAFYLKVHPYNLEQSISNDTTKLKNIALACSKMNTVICKDYY